MQGQPTTVFALDGVSSRAFFGGAFYRSQREGMTTDIYLDISTEIGRSEGVDRADSETWDG
jgi:hypothetical protein